ncbi:DUF5706 domain-containing protein [Nonomuraea sp. NBC_01738]|uniref:Pycsar system effector family protein n=1 Tax=Nonomuraea sp. NBC_01738 TaxID=2976003 RepID=UPI002E0E8C50|nr:DUF5706 domain-containing protein [Nonomuraea sp. NBC_01738]
MSAVPYSVRILEEVRTEANRADTKASILLAALGVGVGGLMGGLLSGAWRPGSLGGPGQVVWWIGTGLAGAAVVAFLAVVYPRVGKPGPRGRVAFYGDVRRKAGSQELLGALERSARAEPELLARQIGVLSRAVSVKYRLIQAGIWCFGGAALCWAVACLVSLI